MSFFTNPRLRTAAVLFLSQSFFTASTIAAFTLSSILAADLSGTDAAAGIPNTLGLVGRALFAYPIGYLMDRIGRRLALVGGYSLMIVGGGISVYAVVAQDFWLFLLGAFFLGSSRSAGDLSRYVAAEVFPFANRAKVLGWIVFAGTIGAIFGPQLVDPSGLWAEGLGLPFASGPFALAAASMVVGSLIVWLFLRPDPRELGREVEAEDLAADLAAGRQVDVAGEERPLSQIFAAPLVRLAIVSMTIGFFVMAFVMVITPLHMDHHNHTTRAISTVIMFHTLGMYGLSGVTGWLIDRFGRIEVIGLGTAILALSCVIAPLGTGMFILSLALFLLGLGWNFTFVGGSSLMSDALSARERGRAQGASETVVAIGSGFASLSVGAVFDRGDYLLVSIVGFAFTLLLAAAIWVWGRPQRPQRTDELESEGTAVL